MSFFSEENFKKYSIFGTFESQFKFNEFNLNESKFEYLQFQNFCGADVKWYPSILHNVYDKESKLSEPYIKNDPKRKIRPFNSTHIPNYTQPQIQAQIKSQIKEEKFLISSEKASNAAEAISSIVSEPVSEIQSHTYNPVSPPAQTVTSPTTKETQAQKPRTNNRNSTPNIYPFDRNTAQVIKNWYPFRFKLIFPKKSVLNATEQREFLELHSKFRTLKHINKSETKQYKRYHYLVTQIEKERQEFFKFLQAYFALAQEDYNFFQHTHIRYINEMLAQSQANVMEFEKFYTRQPQLEFALNQSHAALGAYGSLKPIEIFHFEKMLLQMGTLSKVIFPTINLGEINFESNKNNEQSCVIVKK
jgi:hypothetical protein